MGKGRRLGEEDVLDHQEVQGFQGLDHMADVRIAHNRVLAHDKHGPDGTGPCGVHHLHHGQAGLVRQCFSPGFLELATQLVVIYRLIGGKKVGQSPHIAGALHVVLAPQGVDARGRLADVAGHHGQIGQGEDIVHAMSVLGDAHGVDDGGGAAAGIEPRRFPE